MDRDQNLVFRNQRQFCSASVPAGRVRVCPETFEYPPACLGQGVGNPGLTLSLRLASDRILVSRLEGPSVPSRDAPGAE